MYSLEKNLNDFRDQLQGRKMISGKDIVALGLVQSEATLTRWRASGEGPPYLKISKGKYLFPVDGLLQWIESSLKTPSGNTVGCTTTDHNKKES